MHERLHLHSFGTAEELKELILQNHISSNLGNAPRLAPLLECIKHVAGLGARALVVQHPVQDPDYLAEYHAYYSRFFSPAEKYCKRFHFFASDAKSFANDALGFLDHAYEANENYLGFITIRPVKSSPVAASILAYPKNGEFILCQDKFDVHLAGRTFQVSGTPFMQQDNAVGACAQASIWMSLRTMRKKEGDRAYTPAQITDAATRFLVSGRTLPNRGGLTINQMVEAIRSAGYSTHIMPLVEAGKVNSLQQNKQMLYGYIESGIPVILALYPKPNEGHAVVVVGHAWDSMGTKVHSEIEIQGCPSFKVIHPVSWASPLFIHNDNSGPYLTLPDASSVTYALQHAVQAIPLLPGDVHISGEEAWSVSLGVLKWILDDFSKGGIDMAPLNGRLVLRPYLTERHKFREWAISGGIPKTLQDFYRKKILPRRMWVTEIHLVDHYDQAPNGPKSRIGEIILDASGDAEDWSQSLLSLHMNMSPINGEPKGVVLDRDAMGTDISVFSFDEPDLYSGVVR